MKKQNKKNNSLPDSSGVRAGFHNTRDPEDDLFLKKASIDAFMGSGALETNRVPLTYTDPLFDPVLIFFPKGNIRELNRRLRHYYTYHPVVGHVIDTHVEFSLSDFDLSCEDSSIGRYYNELKEDINLTELLLQAGRDYFLLGESYLYGDWDDSDCTWRSFVQYPPENIEIYKTYSGPGVVYLLKPDEELKRVLTSGKAADQAIASLIPEDFKQCIRNGVPYQLKNDNLLHLARKPAAYVARGSSLVNRVLKYLILEDKLMLLFFTNIEVNVNPVKIWKIGHAEKGLMPTQKQIAEFKSLLAQATSDPSFNIVTHPFVSADFQSPVGKVVEIDKYLDFLYKRILVGLMASDEFIKGSPASYASANVSARLVLSRYLAFRTRVENVVRKKIFLPIAKARNYRDKNGNYILPKFKWKMRNLLNEHAERELFLKLRDKGEIPFKLLAEVLNLDYDKVKADLKEEESSVFDPVYRDVIKEKSKDKGISSAIVEGKRVSEAIQEGLEKGDRITKPGRPTISDSLKKKYEPALTGNESIPPRIAPLEFGKDTKPVGEERVKPSPESKPDLQSEPKPDISPELPKKEPEI